MDAPLHFNLVTNFSKPVYWRELILCTAAIWGHCDQRQTPTPTVLSCRLTQSTGVSHSFTYRTMRRTAYLYKFSVCHELKPGNGARRVKFCRRILDFTSNENVFNKFYFSDEVWFHLSGHINAQNFRTWLATYPHQFIESLLHPQKIDVFRTISREKIVGLFFLYNEIN